MKRFLGLCLAMMLVVGGSVNAFAASSDTLDLPNNGSLEGGSGRSGSEAYASSYVHGGTGFTGLTSVKATVEVADYLTGGNLGKNTKSGSSKNMVYRAAISVPSSKTVSVYGAHQATVSGTTYGLYTEAIGV